MATVSVRYIVDDVDSAIAFYTGHLGFRVDLHPGPGFAMLSRGNLRLLLAQVERGFDGYSYVGSRRTDLAFARILAIRRARRGLLAIARAGRIVVTVDQSHQPRVEAGRLTTDHEAKGVAWLSAEAVGIPKQDRCRCWHSV